MRVKVEDGTVWEMPFADDPDDDWIAWKLRWLKEPLTDENRLLAANLIDAYAQLLSVTDAKRRLVVRAWREELKP